MPEIVLRQRIGQQIVGLAVRAYRFSTCWVRMDGNAGIPISRLRLCHPLLATLRFLHDHTPASPQQFLWQWVQCLELSSSRPQGYRRRPVAFSLSLSRTTVAPVALTLVPYVCDRRRLARAVSRNALRAIKARRGSTSLPLFCSRLFGKAQTGPQYAVSATGAPTATSLPQ